MNEAKQAHVGLLPLVGGAVLPAYDSPRLRSAARPPVSVGNLDRQPADSHPQPLNENRSIVISGSIFWGPGYAEENFPSPGDFKV